MLKILITSEKPSDPQVIKEDFQGSSAYHGMEYMSLDHGEEEYLYDMQIAQADAGESRMAMARIIADDYFKLNFADCDRISSIHNYVNFKDDELVKSNVLGG